MPKIGQCILLGADIEAIYHILIDATQLSEWIENIDTIDVANDFPQVGGTAHMVFKHNDNQLNFRMTATEFVEGEYATFTLEGDLIGTQRWTTTPERGGYRFSIDYEYDLATQGLSVSAEHIIRDILAKSLKNLKSIVETQPVHPYF